MIYTDKGGGTLNTVTTALGTKTMVYDAGVLIGIIGTGNYKSKSFTYSGGQLTDIAVSA